MRPFKIVSNEAILFVRLAVAMVIDIVFLELLSQLSLLQRTGLPLLLPNSLVYYMNEGKLMFECWFEHKEFVKLKILNSDSVRTEAVLMGSHLEFSSPISRLPSLI